jgi:hypothetical protein
VTRPPTPLPGTPLRLTACSAATRWATGVAVTAAAFVAGVGAGETGAGAGMPLPATTEPSTSPTATVSPSPRVIAPITPAWSEATSRFTLSVSSSTTASPAATASPSRLSHFATVASTIDSPRAGTLIS